MIIKKIMIGEGIDKIDDFLNHFLPTKKKC